VLAQASIPIKILLVPGHDNEVWGAQYGNIKEADMTLALATRIFNILKKDKRFEVYITRDSKGYTKKFADYFSTHKDEILAFFSLPSKYINPSLVSENNNNVILDVFEKQKDGIDAKKHFQKILDKADELGVTIYLEPIPRVHKLKSEEHKQKITKVIMYKICVRLRSDRIFFII